MRVSNAFKRVLDCLWIESRIENAANGGVCLGVVTAMGAAVHRPGMSSDQLDVAESSSFRVVIDPTDVHHHWHGGAPS